MRATTAMVWQHAIVRVLNESGGCTMLDVTQDFHEVTLSLCRWLEESFFVLKQDPLTAQKASEEGRHAGCNC